MKLSSTIFNELFPYTKISNGARLLAAIHARAGVIMSGVATYERMAKTPKRPPSNGAPDEPEKKYKQTFLPSNYHAILKALGENEERSVGYYVRKAVKEWMERNGHWPPK